MPVSLAAAALIPAASGAFAQAATGTITGRVANAVTGGYLEGAEVSVAGAAAVLTDRNGGFTLTGVAAGMQRVREIGRASCRERVSSPV